MVRRIEDSQDPARSLVEKTIALGRNKYSGSDGYSSTLGISFS